MSKRKNSLWKNLAAEAFLFLFLSIITVVLIEIHPIQASSTIYIRADGSIDPPTANITRDEFNVTYTFSGNNYETVVIQRDNIILDGAGFTLQVTSGDGIFLDHQSNVTIKNLNIDAGVSSYGIHLYHSSNITIFDCNIYLSGTGISVDYSSYNEIYRNRIERNRGGGIYVTGLNYAHNNLIYNNTIASNDGDGISLGDSRNSVYWNNSLLFLK